MPIHYQSEIKGDYLQVTTSGSIDSVDEMLRYIEEVHGEMARAGLSKLLVDETRCHIHMNLAALEAAADELHEPTRFVLSKPKLAIVSSAVNYSLHQHLFDGADKVQVFLEAEAASHWLAQE